MSLSNSFPISVFSTCKKYGKPVHPSYCLCCEFCLPPSQRVNGKMCPFDSYDYTKD